MATPTDKAPMLDQLGDILARHFNPESLGRRTSIINDVCSHCNGLATEFRNEKCQREFSISGMCQPCQDEMFGTDE